MVAPRGRVWSQPAPARAVIESRRGGAAAHAEPEVLIDVREARAIRAFLDAAATALVDVTPLAISEPGVDQNADIYIAPIVIDLLSPAARPEKAPK